MDDYKKYRVERCVSGRWELAGFNFARSEEEALELWREVSESRTRSVFAAFAADDSNAELRATEADRPARRRAKARRGRRLP